MLRSNLERRVRPFSQGRNVCAVIARAKRTRQPGQKAAARRPIAPRRLAGRTNWLIGQAIRNGHERNEQYRQAGGRRAAEVDVAFEASDRAGHSATELFAWAQQGGRRREGEASRLGTRRGGVRCAAGKA